MTGQDAAEKLLEEASALGQNMSVTWVNDARACEVRLNGGEHANEASVVGVGVS